MIRAPQAGRSGEVRPESRRRMVLALATGGMLIAAAACGARWDDEQRAAVLAGSRGQEVAVTESADGDGSASSGPATSIATTTTAAQGPADGGQVASQPTGDGGGEEAAGDDGGDQPAEAAALPCTAPSDAPGVTDSTITLGTISTLSGAVPGLGASAEGAVRSYVAYRNATGGVCGRELALRTADDGMDNGRHRSLVTEMNSQVLGIVGGIAGGDAGSGATIDELGMPAVTGAISKPFDDAAVTFNIHPYYADVNQPLPKYRWLYDQGVRRAAIAYTAVDQTRSEVALRHEPQMIASGIEVVDTIEIPLSTFSYDSAARRVANSGADYLFFLADGSISASMARSMYDTGYDGLKFAEYHTAYGSAFPELAGPGAEGAMSPIRSVPNEEPGTSPEQDAFLEWMGRVAPDQPADVFAIDSWAAAKAFVDNLEALSGPITREALLDQLASVGEYDAGGLIGPIEFGARNNLGCVIVMRYESGSWRRVAPGQGFMC